MSEGPSADELCKKISSIRTPRETAGRVMIGTYLMYFGIGISGLLILSYSAKLAYEFCRVKWGGKDFQAVIQSAGDVPPGRGMSQTVTLEIMVDGQKREIVIQVPSNASQPLKVGQEVTVRCLPEFPDFHPLVVSLGGGGWLALWNILFYAIIGSLMAISGYSSTMHLKLSRYVIEHGDVAVGRITEMILIKDKIWGCKYEFTPQGKGHSSVQGAGRVEAWTPKEDVVEGASIVILYDSSRPDHCIPYLMSPWAIQVENGDKSINVENSFTEVERDQFKS
ncbi:MAG: hypothetical protein KDA68_04935 [Planctomycetaceae bacterium]|nr:hypothetical protein [Planctomycetaceae bacterium]